ncbi:MAG: hypothetical protein MJZ19_11995 [Paludibacteraceae bacterium]|nr:hypothetical protein [Paludibacteraceae bacterium]
MEDKLTNRIIEIANNLDSEGEVWTRADLASELKSFGINSDSIEIAKYVFAAFEKSGNKKLRSAFITNDGVSYLIDDYKTHHFAQQDNSAEMIKNAEATQKETKKSLSELQDKLAVVKNFEIEAKEDSGSLLDLIKDLDSFTGAKEIAECSAQGKVMFEKYSALKSSYSEAQNDVKAVAKDFVTVRGYVMEILDRQIRALKDVFGDSIVAVAPELFDFSKIEFLDVESMYSQTKLEYDRLSESCPVLMNEVQKNFKESFSKSFSLATSGFKQSQNGSSAVVSLALAAINMYGAHIENQNKVATCKNQLESLKQAIDYDASVIATDYTRLSTIFKTINDIYSPSAAAFCRRSEEVLTSDIKEIFRTAYNDPLVKELVNQRKQLIEERIETELKLVDFITNIAHYKAEISKDEFGLKEKANEYNDALKRKPEKPSIVSKVLSLGASSDAYAQNLLAWKESDYPVVEEYEKLKVEIVRDKEELDATQSQLLELRKKIAKINSEISKLDTKINANISISKDDKIKIASRLESVVRLLKTGKQIVESKLDENSMKAVSIEKLSDDKLPSNISANISSFCNQNGISTNVSEEFVQKVANQENVTISAEDKKAAAIASSKAVATTIVLMDNYISLYKKRVSGDIQLEQYREQIESMKAKFESKMKEIDNKADVLAGIVTRINTSSNKDMLREALIELGDTSFNLSADDIDEIIAGRKRIEI